MDKERRKKAITKGYLYQTEKRKRDGNIGICKKVEERKEVVSHMILSGACLRKAKEK